MHCSRGEFGKAVSEIHAWRRNAKDIITPKSGDNFILPIADGTVQLYGREYGIRKFTLMRDQLASSEDLRGGKSWEASTCKRNMRWRRNPHWFLVDRRGFHLSSSRRISSSALRAERRHIPNSPEIHWRDQENPYDLGCVVRKQCWRFLERRCGSNFVRFMDRIHEVHNIEWETSYRKCVVGGVVYNNSSTCQTWPFVASNMVRHVKSSSTKWRAAMGYRWTEGSTMRETWEASTSLIR